MNKNPLNAILFTHDDLDGAGCRILWEVLCDGMSPETWDVVNCSNYNVDLKVQDFLENGNYDESTIVAFGDICACRPVLEEVARTFKNVKVWDHHATNLFASGIVKDAKIIPTTNDGNKLESGTSIMFNTFCEAAKDPLNNGILGLSKFTIDNPEFRNLELFVDMVRSYDTYEFKSTGLMTPKYLQILFDLCAMNNFVKRYVDRFTGKTEFKYSCSEDDYTGRLISRYDMGFVNTKKEREDQVIASITPDDIIDLTIKNPDGTGVYQVALMYKTVPCNFSELAYVFLQKYSQYDIMCRFSLFNYGRFDFRTQRDNINLGENIAAPLGGGGHPKSAGAPLDQNCKQWMVDSIINALHANKIDINTLN